MNRGQFLSGVQESYLKKYLQDNVVGVDLFYNESYSDSVVADSVNKYKSWTGLKSRLDTLKAQGITGARIHLTNGTSSLGDGSTYTFPLGTKLFIDGCNQLTVNGTFLRIVEIENNSSDRCIISNGDNSNYVFSFQTGLGQFHDLSVIGNIELSNNIIGVADEDKGTLVIRDGPVLRSNCLYGLSSTGRVFIRGRVSADNNVADPNGSLGISVVLLNRITTTMFALTQNANMVFDYTGMLGSGADSSYMIGATYERLFQNVLFQNGGDVANNGALVVKNITGNVISGYVSALCVSDSTAKEYPVRVTVDNNSQVIAAFPANPGDGVNVNANYYFEIVVRQNELHISSVGKQEWGDMYLIDNHTIARPSGNVINILLEASTVDAADSFEIYNWNASQKF